jgi:hypothetical protein
MRFSSRWHRWAWLGAGLIVGWLVSNFWPSTPLHAVATDRAENITIATGMVDSGVEAVFFLDAQSGMLRAGVPSIRQRGGFQAVWEGNLVADLTTVVATVNATIKAQNAARRAGEQMPEIQLPQNAKFMMITGLLDIRQGPARSRPGQTLVYIAEANTGIILAYALPWNPNAHLANQPFRSPLLLWSADKLATALVPVE